VTEKTNHILIFEDRGPNYEEIAEPLESSDKLNGYDVHRFPGDETEEEDQEVMDFLKPRLSDPYPSLVVLDWDLSEYESGVRREHVQSACDEFGIPLCVYHRDEGYFSNPEELKEYEEHLIRIDPKESPDQVADAVATIAKSFVDIRTRLEEADADMVSSAIPEIIGAPASSESQLDQYSLGMSETIGVAKSDTSQEDQLRIVATFIGYWVHNQLLEYPGVLLNRVATASYLGVDHEEFKQSVEAQNLLREAEYEGPFSELSHERWWWTSQLDSIRSDLPIGKDGGLIEGPPLFEELGGITLSEVQCTDASHEETGEAGFYCILKEEPVCKEHSVRPGGWIPNGASKSRISKSEYDKVRAWMPE
jgi:hypothetical protein